jgi:uridine kinase
MINDHLKRLADGEEVKIPYYDFKEGKRYLDRTLMRLKENEVLLLDSLHGLHPDFSREIPYEQKFKLYLEPLLQMKDKDGNYIRWTDLRLIRRMLRDSVHRAYNPEQTLLHWHYVRSSEKRNILPYCNSADYIVNTSMSYEVPLYAAKYKNNFVAWEKKYKDDPLREDAYARASRVRKVLENIESVSDDSPVPGDSVLREFIGGSMLNYH